MQVKGHLCLLSEKTWGGRLMALTVPNVAQTPDARRLSREVFDLLWSLRFVPYQTKGMQIQTEILFGFSCVLTALSPSILVDEFGPRDAGYGDVGELYELQGWVGGEVSLSFRFQWQRCFD